MECSPRSSPSVLSEDEFQHYLSELLSWGDDEAAAPATTCSAVSPLDHPSSPVSYSNRRSPPNNFSPSILPCSAILSYKRDWLSSLLPPPSPSVPLPHPQPQPHRRVLPSLADAYVLISSSHSLSARPSSSSTTIKHLSHCTSPPSQSILAAGGNQHRNRDAVRRSVAFHLLDVKAALVKAHPSDSDTLVNEVRQQMDRTTRRAHDPSALPGEMYGLDTVGGVALGLSDVRATLQAPLLTNSGTLLVPELKESRQDDDTTIRKAQELSDQKLAGISKRASHICNDRERRQGMNGLYRKLHALLPSTSTSTKKKAPVNKCSTLSRTMECIKSLQQQLNELEREKEQALIEKNKREQIRNLKVDAISKNPQMFTNHNFAKEKLDKRVEHENYSTTFVANHESMRKGITKGTIKASHKGGLKRCAKEKEGSVAVAKEAKRIKVSFLNSNVNLDTLNGMSYSVAKCITTVRNLEESPIESLDTTRKNVCIRLLGEDLIISFFTPKRRVAWSRLLEALQQSGICALNVTLSSSPEFYHHCIHGKVSGTFTLDSCDLQQRLMELSTTT